MVVTSSHWLIAAGWLGVFVSDRGLVRLADGSPSLHPWTQDDVDSMRVGLTTTAGMAFRAFVELQQQALFSSNSYVQYTALRTAVIAYAQHAWQERATAFKSGLCHAWPGQQSGPQYQPASSVARWTTTRHSAIR